MNVHSLPAKSILMVAGISLMIGWLAAAPALAQVNANAMCPVLIDQPVDPDQHAEYRGKQVYFCCPMCKSRFLAAPEKYLDRLPQFAVADSSVPHHEDNNHEHAHAAEPHHNAELSATEEGHTHDHATGHGTEHAGGLDRVINYLGKLHPISVHFPIALIVLAAIAEAFTLRSNRSLYADAGRFCAYAAGISAAVTVGLGWAAGASASYRGELATVLSWHRWTGTATGLLAVAAAMVVGAAHRRGERLRTTYRVIVFSGALLASVVGFLGGALIYGLDHLAW